jgi:hypothetical protein
MSAAIATMSSLSLRAVHSQFVAALPAIEKVLRFELRRVPRQARADAFADVLAATWAAWRSLVQRGKDPLQVGPTGIAARCCLGTKAGRKVGNMNSGRGCLDVHDHRAQRRLGLTVHNPDEPDEFAVGASSEVWRECVAEDNRVSPADEAAFHVDFEVWLAGLPRRKREMAELLAEGRGTSEVASLLNVSLPAVSITRAWLETSWREFQGESVAAAASDVRRPVGRPRKAAGRVQEPRRKEHALVAAGAC